MAFHPRLRIAGELGRNLTCSSNPHRNRKRYQAGTKLLAYGMQIPIVEGLYPLRFENHNPNRPCTRWSEHPKSQTHKPQSQNLGRCQAAAGRRIAQLPATRPLRAPSSGQRITNKQSYTLPFPLCNTGCHGVCDSRGMLFLSCFWALLSASGTAGNISSKKTLNF